MEMALPDEKTQHPVPVQITVLRAHYLKGVKSDFPVTYVRSEFNNVLLGDSPKLESSVEKSTEYNFTSSFDVGPDGPHSVDDVAYKPVVLTVLEILPKEKKQKEEKTVVLGQTTVNLLPLLKGECNVKVTLPIHAVPGSPLETARPESKPSLEVAVSIPEPLLSQEQINKGNLLTVSVEGAYSVPESWNSTGPQYNYVASLHIPAAGEKPRTLLFSNGVLKPGGEMETVPRPKKWPVSGIMATEAQYLPESFVPSSSYEAEDGELNRKEDKEFRRDAETNRKRLMWDMDRRCYLEPSALSSLQMRIAECRYWPVEIMRLPIASTSKAKTGKADKGEEDFQVSFHGVAFVNMVPLLYPGIKSLRGAFRVFPYAETEVFDKTKSQVSVLRDVVRQSALINKPAAPQANIGSPHVRQVPSRTLKDEKGPKEAGRRMSALLKATDFTGDGDGVLPVLPQNASQNLEGQQYTEAGTYILLELSLEKAMVPKRSSEELDIKVKELLPPRPQLPRRTMGAQKAVADYQNQITSITNSLLEEYWQLFGQQVENGQEIDRQTLDEQKSQLNYELNCSGKYFAFKEQLKHAVVKIVREKYLRTTAFEDPEQLQTFLSELYIYLVDQMHITLNKTLFEGREDPPPPPMSDPEQLYRFAREAELNEDFTLAELYYQERLARDSQSVGHWLDYGKFKLLIGDHIKAQECFHEALVRDRNHLHSLLLCGIMAVLNGKYDDAEVFFEDATCVDPTSTLARTMLGLFYEIQGNDIRMEMAFSDANKLCQPKEASERPSPATDTIDPDNAPVAEEETSEKGASASVSTDSILAPEARSIFMELAQFLAQANATQFVHRALAHELLCPDGDRSCKYRLLRAQMHLQRKEVEEAKENLDAALQVDYQCPDVWAFLGHLHIQTGNRSDARDCYEHTLNLVDDASEMHPVFLRLGSIYLEEGEYEKAKNTYLMACKRSPTCLSWLGVGIACYRLDEMEEAEGALSEANVLNNHNPEVWGYLALICLKTGKQQEAEQCYKYTSKLNLQNTSLLAEIRQLQQQVGVGDPSF
ncbi:cilia- and flagella-associated protein 70 [Pelobates fuscus]|uniref:cilia- and flagella-associated protein 70 n=1 Tax=Pelobates fuscus TaxID=191477 RepID=UPI002FE449E0